MEKAHNALAKLLPSLDAIGYFRESFEKFEAQREQLAKSRGNHQALLREQLALVAQREYTEGANRLIEQSYSTEQRELDLWMQRYNANNPPVQMGELERLLTDGRDWSEIRRRVREITMQQTTTQQRVDRLRSQIISLQADGLRPIADNGENEQEALQAQLDELEEQRRKILQQIARLDEQLRLHKQTMAAP